MKRLSICIVFLALLLSGCSTLNLATSIHGNVGCKITYSAYGNTNADNLVTFRASGNAYDGSYVSYFRMDNNTGERVYIEWENARLDGGKVVFDSDTRLTMGNPKADEAVSAHSHSIMRNLTSMNKVTSDSIRPIYEVSELKKGKTRIASLNIPVKFSNGKVIEYKVYIEYFWNAEGK